jgi:hypothetical protein
MRHSILQRNGTDTAIIPDQVSGLQGIPMPSMHSRKGSGGSLSNEGSGSFSSSMSAAWGLADRLQQQPSFKKHRSRFVQAMHKLQELAGVQSAQSVLPVADSHKR